MVHVCGVCGVYRQAGSASRLKYSVSVPRMKIRIRGWDELEGANCNRQGSRNEATGVGGQKAAGNPTDDMMIGCEEGFRSAVHRFTVSS